MKMKTIDISEEMKKEPEARAPGTFEELLKQALEYGQSQGAKHVTKDKE